MNKRGKGRQGMNKRGKGRQGMNKRGYSGEQPTTCNIPQHI